MLLFKDMRGVCATLTRRYTQWFAQWYTTDLCVSLQIRCVHTMMHMTPIWKCGSYARRTLCGWPVRLVIKTALRMRDDDVTPDRDRRSVLVRTVRSCTFRTYRTGSDVERSQWHCRKERLPAMLLVRLVHVLLGPVDGEQQPRPQYVLQPLRTNMRTSGKITRWNAVRTSQPHSVRLAIRRREHGYEGVATSTSSLFREEHADLKVLWHDFFLPSPQNYFDTIFVYVVKIWFEKRLYLMRYEHVYLCEIPRNRQSPAVNLSKFWLVLQTVCAIACQIRVW